MPGYVKILALVIAVGVAGPAPAQTTDSTDPALTPAHVFGLWMNINRALLELAAYRVDDKALLDGLAAMQARPFTGKVPRDVLAEVDRFDKLLERSQLAAGAHREQTLIEKELASLLRDRGSTGSPREVYLRSSHALLAILESVNAASGGRHMLSPLLAEHYLEKMTPSDVFGLVDLGVRRLGSITAWPPAAAATPGTGG